MWFLDCKQTVKVNAFGGGRRLVQHLQSTYQNENKDESMILLYFLHIRLSLVFDLLKCCYSR